MEFSSLDYRYPSARHLIYGRRGMVCTSQPLAAQAGLDVLKQGGNAADAAVAAAACLTVMEPGSNGIGGDAFALIWKDGRLYGLNGSGPSPELLTAEAVKAAGYGEIPEKGWIPVTVPGAPGSWAELTSRFGRRSLKENLQPAVSCAEEGYPVSPLIARSWKEGKERLSREGDREEFREWFRVFAEDGRTPGEGELWYLPDHARTLKRIGETNARDFYEGELAERMDEFSRKTGGYLRKSDLEKYRPEWVTPVSVGYKGYDVWELPPNGHGIVALMALKMLEGLEVSGHDDVETIHRQIEAVKLAFADGQAYIADPAWMEMPVSALLSQDYAGKRAGLIKERAALPGRGDPYSGGTAYVCAADEDGMMVSFIQSGYDDFGSGIVVPGTGINLQDRGCSFSLDPANPNYLGPGKKPYHTIIPGFLTRDGNAVGPFGVIGGFMQPQGHVQMIMNMIDFYMNPQEALNAPRWQWRKERKVELEPGFGPDVIQGLWERGHEILVPENPFSMGRGQIIIRNKDGIYAGATEPRADGCVAAW